MTSIRDLMGGRLILRKGDTGNMDEQ